MMSSVRRFWPAAIVALLFVAPGAFAQNSNFYFNGSYQGTQCVSAGCVDSGFYGGSINNVNVSGGFVSDDYLNVSKGESWSAHGIDVASLNNSNIKNTMFGSSIGLAGYAEVAFLVNQMYSQPLSAAMQTAYSQAIWFITSNGKSGLGSLNALGLVLNAAVYVARYGDSLSQYANLWLYTPTSGGPETWVSVPEGGSALVYLLIAFSTCMGVMLFRSRRPTKTIATA